MKVTDRIRIFYFLTIVGICTSCYDVFERDISGDQVVLQAPADNAVADSIVVFWWNSLAGASQYRLRIVSPSLDSADFQFLDTVLTATTYRSELPRGRYQWCVQGMNAGYETVTSCRSITSTLDVIDISSEEVMLLEPSDGSAVGSNEDVMFRWESLYGATRYRLTVTASENDETVILDEITSEDRYETKLPPGNYQWCVQGLNAVYKTSAACYSIESVKNIAQESVTLVEPAEIFTGTVSDSVEFKWEVLDGAMQYRLRIASPNMDNVVTMFLDTVLNNPSCMVLLTEGEYEWCVQGINSIYETGNICRTIEITP